MTESREAKPSSSNSSGAAVIAILLLALLPLLYVLSIGPVIWLDSRGYIQVTEDSLIAWFYWPIIWGANHFAPISQMLEWYAELWTA